VEEQAQEGEAPEEVTEIAGTEEAAEQPTEEEQPKRTSRACV
jgi:hypothetical protein